MTIIDAIKNSLIGKNINFRDKTGLVVDVLDDIEWEYRGFKIIFDNGDSVSVTNSDKFEVIE